MSRALPGAAVAALAFAAALAQAVLPGALALDVELAPALPVALLAAWAAVRAPGETPAAAVCAALPLGVLSAERTGWFVLALLPTVALALLPQPRVGHRVLRAALAGAGGGAAYLAVLLLAAGRWRELLLGADVLLPVAATTAAVAFVLGLALWPWRERPRSLFA
ncbi:MAG: hypothetical protein EXR63_05935 [Dehalococcoidia bacterium]|nr:hypothetical protein [Dehalococcoidia bacterium]